MSLPPTSNTSSPLPLPLPAAITSIQLACSSVAPCASSWLTSVE